MTRRWFLASCAMGLAVTAPGPAGAEPSRGPEIAVIVHKDNPLGALGTDELEAIFSLSRRTWTPGNPILVFSYAPQNPVRIACDQAVLNLNPEQAARFWVDRRVRDGVQPPRHLADSLLMLRLVSQLRQAIGYVPAKLVTADVRVIARIVGGKVVKP